jgi:hypothetical protein
MIKTKAASLSSVILASFLGIFGQGMAYYFNENFFRISPLFYLTLLTIVSLILYITSILLTFILYMKREILSVDFWTYFSLIGFIGLFISSWSIFVLAMWWG